jgi:uncharacterized membrane protein
MAVSPFAVYLSQEARHYTLPMLFITLALLGLIRIQQTLYSQRQLPRPGVWFTWGVVNSIGCYIHYFFILAFIAQLLTLTGLMYWRRRMLPRGSFLAVGLVVSGVAVSYLPWLSVMLGSFGRSETGWLPKPENIAPLYQTLVGWLSMVIALPVEGQPLWVQVPVALLTIGFGSWVGWQAWRGLKQLWRQPETHIATFTLSCFTLCVLLQFIAIIYLLGKDITVAPRYNFVYFPAVCALLGATLAMQELKVRRLTSWKVARLEGSNQSSKEQPANLQPANLQPANLQPTNLQPANLQPTKEQLATQIQPSTVVFCVSLLSCVFVVSSLVFLKPFHPQQVARDMNLDPGVPIRMVVGYDNFQEVALGVSFALAIDQLNSGVSQGTADASFAFFNRKLGYELVWQKLSKLPTLSVPRLNLWVVAPGLRRRDYPPQVAVGQTSCTIDATEHHRIGVPYQLYRCQ